LGCRQAV